MITDDNKSYRGTGVAQPGMIQLSEKRARHSAQRYLTRLAALILFSGSALVSQQASAGIHEDAMFEVSFGVGISIPADDFKNNFEFAPPTNFIGEVNAESGKHLTVSGGYFLFDQLSVGVSFAYSQFDIDPAITNFKYRLYSFGLYGKYHFSYESRVTPYLRVQGGIVVPNFNTPLRTVGLGFRENGYGLSGEGLVALGARLSTSDWGGFYLEVGYRYSDVAGSQTSFKQETYELPADVAQVQITAGFSFDIASGD